MKQAFHTIAVPTHGAGLYEFTDQAADFVRGAGIEDGLLTCFIRHTSASLVIQENADPDVQKDLRDFFAWLATSGPKFRHTTEGPDDMPSHIRSALTQTSIGIPLHRGRLALGTWQGIYVFEHRDAPHRREVMLHVTGE
ncbi:MAG TPA: secondary thiamine-phosphate synthase enzyme YjbQ [Rhizomicrobium sp.]|nr:secondary thiamine-phosphate synthase enzyme YjbQ [Rhizomicrobium sp.]